MISFFLFVCFVSNKVCCIHDYFICIRSIVISYVYIMSVHACRMGWGSRLYMLISTRKFVELPVFLVLILTIFKEGAYLTFKSIFHKALNLF